MYEFVVRITFIEVRLGFSPVIIADLLVSSEV